MSPPLPLSTAGRSARWRRVRSAPGWSAWRAHCRSASWRSGGREWSPGNNGRQAQSARGCTAPTQPSCVWVCVGVCVCDVTDRNVVTMNWAFSLCLAILREGGTHRHRHSDRRPCVEGAAAECGCWRSQCGYSGSVLAVEGGVDLVKQVEVKLIHRMPPRIKIERCQHTILDTCVSFVCCQPAYGVVSLYGEDECERHDGLLTTCRDPPHPTHGTAYT